MKKLLLAALTLAVLSTALPAQAGNVKLTYSNFFPPTHVQSQLAEAWCKEVEKRTGGAVSIDYFPGGTLTKAKQCYDGVVEGLSDIGFSVLAYSRGRFPVMAAVDLPLGYQSGVVATKVANGVNEKFQPKEFDDVQVMYFHAHGPGLLHTAKKPVRSIEDMKGLKLRATGNSAKVVSALGGTPVAMSMPDSYQAIQKGVVNGGMYPVETNKGWKMGEVVDYMTDSGAVAYTTTFFVVMNKDRWAEIPADAQKAILEINAEWSGKHGQAWDDSDKAGMEFFKAQGGEVIPLADAETDRWKAACAPMLEAYTAEATKKGLDGKAVLDYIVATLNSLQ
ncbi:TRAP transporter substrate-binding protein [Desulfovibrio ferrophilus]|uniref:Family 7 extracellular solute-binding protein n=1 Tax=Desulfovibrio ferrophilus TaxID=241368 RepID=A0A2Z6B3H4_9BACT|nr:TRAP transporter substrate-binding protein [Desulfovibrio ferrophilus]BBD10052.1 family 7 extracellular solute-binding protein [Desulfovibrio ferrophilus]